MQQIEKRSRDVRHLKLPSGTAVIGLPRYHSIPRSEWWDGMGGSVSSWWTETMRGFVNCVTPSRRFHFRLSRLAEDGILEIVAFFFLFSFLFSAIDQPLIN